MARVETQLHRRRHLVDILPSRSRGSHEGLLELGWIDGYRGGDVQPGAGGGIGGFWGFRVPPVNKGLWEAAMTLRGPKTIDDLLAVMAALRTPGSGCPWDLQQTFKTIVPYTIEEAYEVADAIDKQDRTALKDELGDLLLQVVYHARMAEEEGA